MTQALTQVQQRLAQHYVNTLQRANTAIQRGRGNRSHWYNQIEQDWEQIRHWHAWSASASDLEKERTKLCIDFSIGGLDVLRVRQTPADRIQWMKTAQAAAHKVGNITAECTALHELGHTYFYVGATDEATAAAQMLLALAEPTNDRFNLGRAWYILGQVGVHQGNLDEAEAALTKSIALLQAVGAEAEYGRALQAYGRIALFRGDNPTAYERFSRYLSIVERSGREAELAPAYITMNHVLLEMHDYQQAKHYAELALQVTLKTGFQRMLGNVWLCLAAAESELDELDAACAHYLQGIANARAMQANSTLIDLLRYLGDAEMRRNNYPDAQRHLEEAMQLAQQHNISYYLCEISAAMARWHIDQGQAEPARAHLRTAIDYAQQLRAERFLVVVLLTAVTLKQLEGHAEQAVMWFGMLGGYTSYIEPRVYATMHARLRQGLEAAQFDQALARGADLQLAAVVEAVRAELEQA